MPRIASSRPAFAPTPSPVHRACPSRVLAGGAGGCASGAPRRSAVRPGPSPRASATGKERPLHRFLEGPIAACATTALAAPVGVQVQVHAGVVHPASLHRRSRCRSGLLRAGLLADERGRRRRAPTRRRSALLCAPAHEARVLPRMVVAFCYHLVAGIRHLVWDTGRGLERAQVAAQRLARGRAERRADAACSPTGCARARRAP